MTYALDQAKQRILSGPDTPGKKFLLARMAEQTQKRQMDTGPDLIGRLKATQPVTNRGRRPFRPESDPELWEH